jgi:hypothetical protein
MGLGDLRDPPGPCCAGEVRFAQPRTVGAGRVQSVAADQSQARVGEVLQQLSDEVGGAEDLAVGLEAGVVGAVIQDRCGVVFHDQLAA